MTDDLIIRQLQEKETRLIAELNKVRLALNAFLNNEENEAIDNDLNEAIPAEYSPEMTYAYKILFVLNQHRGTMLVSEIVETIHILEPRLDKEKLQKNISYNLSMLAKYNRIRKHPFNRNIKYSL